MPADLARRFVVRLGAKGIGAMSWRTGVLRRSTASLEHCPAFYRQLQVQKTIRRPRVAFTVMLLGHCLLRG